MSEVMWPPLTWANTFFIGTSFIINLALYLKMLRQFPFLKFTTRTERDPKSNLLYYFYWISFAAFLLIPVNVWLIIDGLDYPFIEDFHGTALVLSALIFIETYFLWRYPEIIKEERTPALPVENSHDLVEKLNSIMLTLKPYKKADLTISDLADILDTRPHVLSRIINDSYQKNFRDFVNTYRIEEFITLADTKEFKHYTFLALAQEVGFNSKSTFNLAFKKLTNQSPRDYFKSRE
jgi:AraC-like DNA-binding protein